MEGSPDEEPGQPGALAPGTRGPQRPRAEPNLWILIGITVLSLVIAVGVLALTVIG